MNTNNKEGKSEQSEKTVSYKERNALYKKKREHQMKENGFINSKLYLGRDTYARLAVIHKLMRGDELPNPSDNKGKKDIEAFSSMISYCIVKVYKEMIIRKNKSSETDDIPNIEPAKTKRAQETYNIYQRVHYQNPSWGDFANDQSHKSISTKSVYQLNQDNVEVPELLQISPKSKKKNVWTARLVNEFLHVDTLNEIIRSANKAR